MPSLTRRVRLPVGSLLFITACVSVGKRMPTPTSAEFTPRGEYDTPYESLWSLVGDVLDDNRIIIASSNKEEGRIVSDYVEGGGQVGVLGGLITRYRYNMRLTPLNDSQTKLLITASLESSASKVEQWHDISSSNQGIVHNLELWLYEQIEQSLDGGVADNRIQ